MDRHYRMPALQEINHYFYILTDGFIQSDLRCIPSIIFISMCVLVLTGLSCRTLGFSSTSIVMVTSFPTSRSPKWHSTALQVLSSDPQNCRKKAWRRLMDAFTQHLQDQIRLLSFYHCAFAFWWEKEDQLLYKRSRGDVTVINNLNRIVP